MCGPISVAREKKKSLQLEALSCFKNQHQALTQQKELQEQRKAAFAGYRR